MITDIVSLIDWIIKLAGLRKEGRRNLFKDQIDPLFEKGKAASIDMKNSVRSLEADLNPGRVFTTKELCDLVSRHFHPGYFDRQEARYQWSGLSGWIPKLRMETEIKTEVEKFLDCLDDILGVPDSPMQATLVPKWLFVWVVRCQREDGFAETLPETVDDGQLEDIRSGLNAYLDAFPQLYDELLESYGKMKALCLK